MKKTLFLIISIICFIGAVNAEEYVFNYRTKNAYASFQVNTMYKNGFVFSDSGYVEEDNGGEYKTYLSYYDEKGNTLKTNLIDKDVFLYMVSDNNYIYALVGTNVENDYAETYSLYKLDENLNIVKRKELEQYKPIFEIRDYRSYTEGIGMNDFILEDNKIKIFTYILEGQEHPIFYNASLQVDLNLNTVTLKKLSETNDFKAYRISNDAIQPQLTETNESYLYGEPTELGENIMFSLSKKEGACFDSNTIGDKDYEIMPLETVTCQANAYLVLYDTNGTKKWEKQIKGYSVLHNLRITEKYIVAIGSKGNSDILSTLGTDILILDHEGNIVQTISDGSFYARLEANDAVLTFTARHNKLCPEAFPFDEHTCDTDTTHEVYLLEYEIETKVTKGKGTVEAIRTSKAGESVTFVVTPDEGYILGEVKVTDKNGNVIVFKNNTFTMPSADVLVEATFLVKNAETKDIAITLVALLAVITGGLVVIQWRRIKTY